MGISFRTFDRQIGNRQNRRSQSLYCRVDGRINHACGGNGDVCEIDVEDL